jgi:hypothetical protein
LRTEYPFGFFQAIAAAVDCNHEYYGMQVLLLFLFGLFIICIPLRYIISCCCQYPRAQPSGNEETEDANSSTFYIPPVDPTSAAPEQLGPSKGPQEVGTAHLSSEIIEQQQPTPVPDGREGQGRMSVPMAPQVANLATAQQLSGNIGDGHKASSPPAASAGCPDTYVVESSVLDVREDQITSTGYEARRMSIHIPTCSPQGSGKIDDVD